MMKLQQLLATLAVAVGFTTAVTAATPVAVWENDFTTATKEGWTIAENGNTFSADKSSITIGSGVNGVLVTNATAKATPSIIIRYSNLSYPGENKGAIVITQAKATTGDNQDWVGVAATGTDGKPQGNFQGKNYKNDNDTKEALDSAGVIGFYYNRGSNTTLFSQPGTATRYYSTGLKASSDANATFHGFSIGGNRNADRKTSTNNGITYASADGMVITGIAVFETAITADDVAAFAWPSYEKFASNPAVLTYNGAGTFHSAYYNLFGLGGLDTGISYNGNASSGTTIPGQSGAIDKSWKIFSSDGTNGKYVAPGYVLRFAPGVGTPSAVNADFNPLTFGGMIVEEGATGWSVACTKSNAARTTELGDRRTTDGAATWYVFHEDFAFNRISTADSGAVKNNLFTMYGDINFQIDADKTVNVQKGNAYANPTLDPARETVFRMHGEGTLVVNALVATGTVTLDYSDLPKDREAAYIDGGLTCDAGTKFIFPADLAENESFALCSGTLTGVDGIHEVTVGDETFFARLTANGSAVSYAKVSADTATVSGDTTWSELSQSFVGGLPVELTLTADSEIDFNKAVTIPGLTLKGGYEATLTQTVTPAIAEIKTENGSTYAIKFPSGGDRDKTAALTVPADATYIIAGGAETADVWSGAITVNGTLKTEGKLSFSNGGNAVPAGGTLEVISGELTLNGAGQGMAGTLTIESGAKVTSAKNDFISYGNTSPVLNIKGTLDYENTRWTIGESSNTPTVNLYAGARILGTGDQHGAFQFNKANTFNVVAAEGEDTVAMEAKVYITVNPTVNVPDGLTLDFSGPFKADGKTIALSGAGTIRFSTDYVTNVYVNAGSSGTFVFAGTELVLQAGSERTVTVAEGSTLKLRVTAAQLASGYTASGVTLTGGQNVTFVTPAGKEIVGSGTELPSQTMAWTGAAGDGLWATAGNWSTETIPTAVTPVQFDESAVVTVAEGDTAAEIILNAGLTITNDCVFALPTIAGTATAVTKCGSGTMTAAIANDFSVQGGTLQASGVSTVKATRTVTVEEGATFDYNGKADGYVALVLNGGSFVNNGGVMPLNKRQIEGISLTADSTIGGSGRFGMSSDGHHANVIDLGGSMLTKTGTNTFFLCNTTVTNGTVRVTDGALEILESAASFVEAGLTLEAGTVLKVGSTLNVGAITANGATIDNAGTISGFTLTGSAALAGNGTWGAITLSGNAVVEAGAVRNLSLAGTGKVNVVLTADELAQKTPITVFTAESGSNVTVGTVKDADGNAVPCKVAGGVVKVLQSTVFFLK